MQPNIEQMAKQSYQGALNLQNMLNGQAQNATNQYNTSYNQAQGAQQQLQDFSKNMQSGADIYAKALQGANQNAGYDVNNLNQAQNQVSQITGILGGLPRAVQAQNANYGATAGDVAGQYATEAGNLNQSLGLANQNAANQIAKMQGGLSGAQAGATTAIQGQQNQLQGYQAAAANATNVMQQAQLAMTNLQQMAQQQGTLTASQQQTYAQARQAYAAAAQAYAQANLASAQAKYQNLQTQDYQNVMNAGGNPSIGKSAPMTPAQTRASNLANSQRAAATANQQAQAATRASNDAQNNPILNFGHGLEQFASPITNPLRYILGL